MRSRLRAAVGWCVVLTVLLGGCDSEPGGTDGSSEGFFPVDVDVDTPELRSLKKQAGVEPCRPGEPSRRPANGMPDLTLECLGGGPDVNLRSLRGPLVVNLWAQWCGPCREELPYYQRLHEAADGKVRVLGIDYEDTQPGAALELVRDAGVTYPLLADPAGALDVPLGVRGLPGVVFVDREGNITHTEYVVIGSYGQLRDLVGEHLGVELAPAR